ncbi:MAG: glutathione peroxidase [Chitinophagales bacterium]|nr:glutathione peroxidase [Chitinophagales bacterium]
MKIILTALLVAVAALNPSKTVYDYTVKDIDGKEVSLGQYKGKVLLIVNVASLCGNTPQYKDIEALYEKYKSKGLVVLGFPANNFMGQEPGSDKEIKQFCTKEYAVTFPMFSKISVKGKDIAPLYSYLTQKEENGVVDAKVGWNFQKFLVSKKGTVIQSVAPGTSVNNAEVMAAIEKALAE